MVVYDKYVISGIEFTDVISANVRSSVSENEAISTASLELDNYAGIYANTFTPGDEVIICADKDRLIMPLGSPYAHFLFNTSGTFEIDTCRGISGTFESGAQQYGNGKIGSCLYFYTAGSKTPNQSGCMFISGNALQISGNLTICMWLYANTLGYRRNPIDKSYGGEFTFTQETAGNINFYHGSKASTPNYQGVNSLGSMTVGSWYHWGLVRNNDIGSIIWYINAVETNRVRNTFLGGSISVTGSPVKVGFGYVGSAYDGYIDDLRFYNIALSPSNIQAIYNSGSGTEFSSCGSQKIFDGLIKDIEHSDKGLDEKISIKCEDYSKKLKDGTIEPIVYNNCDPAFIIDNILDNNIEGLTDVNVGSTLSNVTHVSYNHKDPWTAIKDLAKQFDRLAYVDVDKDLHFEVKSTSSSGYTLGSTNVTTSKFKTLEPTANQVWVYGGRQLVGVTEYFTGDGGSVFTFANKVHNTIVYNPSGGYIVGNLPLVGGVYQMLSNPTGVQYLINYDGSGTSSMSQIVFTSGTAMGDNIPRTGSIFEIQYQKSAPIAKYGEDAVSINLYGKKPKVVINKDLTNPNDAKDLVYTTLDRESMPIKQGQLQVQGVASIQAGKTVVVNLPNKGINNQTYDVIESNYNFSKNNNLMEDVLKVKVSKRVPDISDAIRELLISLRQIQMSEISATDVITRLQTYAGSFGPRVKTWTAYTRTLTSSDSIYDNPAFATYGTNVYVDGYTNSLQFYQSGGEV